MTNVILLKNPSIPTDPYEVKFRSENYIPKFIPLLTHGHVDKQATITYLQSQEFSKIGIFIITSQRAVEILRECIDELDEVSRCNILKKTGYTVGPATYKILREVGFHDVRGGDDAGNGAKLAQLIMEDVKEKSESMVFFTGEIRKDTIPRILLGKGYDLIERVIYKTSVCDDVVEKFDLVKDDGGWLIFFSPQGTESIVAYLKENKQGWKVASIGPTTEEYLLENDITPEVVAPKPEPNSLFGAIEKIDCIE
ncbi:Uroporphyrinogen-III synthase [Spathaspora sp. JA1]|nr:Uroporphyrinogen-III synthase [Spathaspora sp. JA1]